MKKYLLVFVLLFVVASAFPQTGKTTTEKPPSQSDIDKMMEEATKGMSAEEKAQMKKIMGGVMPELMQANSKTANYPAFTNNKQLVPPKDIVKINAMSKKLLKQADINGYVTNLYNKLMAKGNTTEMALAKKIISQSPKANDISNAAILAMMQGHPQAAMAMSMKAVLANPTNPNYQNNLASLLTQYGYPEQAVPLLKKLSNDFPENSTVVNNLAHAWLGLGEIDSARSIIKKAGGLNPYHPEAKQTEGVIEEITGNPVKAAENYQESMENAINPFTEQLIKNNKGHSNSSLDYEKLKSSITIYEYFRKDWIKIPALSDNVAGYETDMAIQNGYSKMFDELKSKIEVMKEASEAEINTLADESDDGTNFANAMMKESMKGINAMSKPAVVIQIVLQNYIADWMMKYTNENIELRKLIDAKKVEMTKYGSNDKCADFDNKNNQFLQYANPIIREFHSRKVEEFRAWLNTFCTWVWYLTGNPKNTVMMQCITWTAAITDFYKAAIEDQKAIARSCVKQNDDGIRQVALPEIPNFSCPTLVRMPMGSDWKELGNAGNNFNNNKHAIEKSHETPVPSQTIAYGVDHTSIAEPGPDPFIKSAMGSMTPGIVDPELSPAGKLAEIAKKYKERRILDFKLGISPEKTAEYFADDMRRVLEEARAQEAKDKAAEQRMKDYLKSKIERAKAEEAKGVEAFREYIKSKIAYSKTADYKSDIEKAMEVKNKILQKNKLAHELLKKMMSADCRNLKTAKEIQKELFEKGMMEAGDNIDDLREKGLSPSLSSGLQAPGTFAPVKGLFN